MEIWLNEVCDSSLTRYSKHLLLVIFHQCDIAIFCKLREFFQNNPSNHIEFWDCLSSDKWPPHLTADQETKFYSTQPLHPSQMSWKLSRKDECDSYLCTWQMYFQASNYKGKNFLRQQWQTNHSSNLFQRGAWLKYVGQSNMLTACIIWLITNHAPIGEYKQQFFPNKPCAYPFQCGDMVPHSTRVQTAQEVMKPRTKLHQRHHHLPWVQPKGLLLPGQYHLDYPSTSPIPPTIHQYATLPMPASPTHL